MNSIFDGGLGLGSIARLGNAQTRSISAENPDGAKGGGGRAVPDKSNPITNAASHLGRGWKVAPCITLSAGKTTTLADIRGPGVIQHIWITVDPKAFTSVVLRMFFDDSPTPSVEVPLGDFFACGHGLRTKIVSIPVAVNPAGGMNSYWPMPFRKSARITVENQWHEEIGGFFYQITYALTDVPDDAGIFHAQYRRSLTRREHPEHTILDNVRGHGHYVGTYLAWAQMSNGWWGEGEIKFFLDGDGEFPTICGTGTEDYFCGAWCFTDANGREEQFSAPFSGLPLSRHIDNEIPRHGMYRWHIPDPIHFASDLKVTIQALGWWPNSKYQPLTDDIASTAFWYQALPHAPFPALPPMEARYSR